MNTTDVARGWDGWLRAGEDDWFEVDRADLRALVDAALECADRKDTEASLVDWVNTLSGELDAARAQVAAMREALEELREEFAHKVIYYDDGDLGVEEFVSRALTPTAGTDWEARIRAEEREACARIAEALGHEATLDPYCCTPLADSIAAAIRARGKK